ncbi:MAG: hypothetical protein NZV14_04110 [Bryobacteraceae bacterium]|nr:hypothetical protein [Bryobacteraceae bacterium]MDW8377316.1 hypothetical protein [Bryobacterales bacterium]
MHYRLGDDVDDYCVKCKRITNHSIVSLVNSEPAKVRCRTCYHDHDYLRCEIPPSKKDLKKMALLAESLAAGAPTQEESQEDSAAASAEASFEPGDSAKTKRAAKKARG